MPTTSWDQTLIRCAHVCDECAAACQHCADECAREADVVELARCMRTDLDCADICTTTSRYVSRSGDDRPGLLAALLETCLIACAACAGECERHDYEHCRSCAAACRRCEAECRELLRGLRLRGEGGEDRMVGTALRPRQ
jgi:hypothetical protein